MDKNIDKKKIGIDLDNTITASNQSIRFFSVMTNLLKPEYEIHIITNRTPGTEIDIQKELLALGIHYDHLKITDQKAEYIRENNITILFEDNDEYFQELILEETLVFKIREAGGWEDDRWVGSKKTVKMID